jgi:hypothetical protein
MGNLTYVDSGEQTFQGTSMHFDQYLNSDGETIQFLTVDGQLRGMRTWEKEDDVAEISVIAFDQELPAKIFDIPKNYKTINQ